MTTYFKICYFEVTGSTIERKNVDITETNNNGHPETFKSAGDIPFIPDPDVYPMRVVAVGNLFDRLGNLPLLLRRKGDPGTGAPVELPGGGVLKHESIREGLVREVCEELNHKKLAAGLSQAHIVRTHFIDEEVKVLGNGEVLRLTHWACLINRLFSEVEVNISPDHEAVAVIRPNSDRVHVPYEDGPIRFYNLPLERQEHVLEGHKAIFGSYPR